MDDDQFAGLSASRKEKPMFQRSTFQSPAFQSLVIAALLAMPLCALAAEDKAKTPQQEKMATCNKEAGDKALKGDERKKFMSECLKAARMSQQEKMKACNKEAAEKALKGDERKKFMSDCLKGPAKS
jgi:psiF repeat